MEQFAYTKEDLQNRLDVVNTNGEKIQKCLEYAIGKLSEYHNQGAKGLIVDDAMYDVYAKIDAALTAYTNYNNRVTTKITAKLDELAATENEKPSSNIPRRSIRIAH